MPTMKRLSKSLKCLQSTWSREEMDYAWKWGNKMLESRSNPSLQILFYLVGSSSISKKQLNWYCENVILELSHSSLSMTQWLSSTHSFLYCSSPLFYLAWGFLQRGRRNKSSRHKKSWSKPKLNLTTFWDVKSFCGMDNLN